MEKVVRSSQEQAVASLIDRLNQVRLDNFISALREQDINYTKAFNDLESTLKTIKNQIIETNRGGLSGMHGFIAEVAECGIGNARQHIMGLEEIYKWVNDNGPIDILRGTEQIQQKFSKAGGHLSLSAILDHIGKYPDFIKDGKYQVPKDFYEKIKYYLSIPETEAYKMPTSTGEFSFRQWKEVNDIVGSGKIPIDKIEPSFLNYADAQAGKIGDRINEERELISDIDKGRRDAAYQASKPSTIEGAKATAVAAAIEGLTSFILALARKKRSKNLCDFTAKDWTEIIAETGKGSIKGGLRGLSIYALTNYTATPAAIASALATATFGVADLLYNYRKGEITELQFIENSESLCLDAAVSGLSSLIGQTLIPVPVLGAVVGNAVGTIIYQGCKDIFYDKEYKIITEYLENIKTLNSKLDQEYQEFINNLNTAFDTYIGIIERICSVDVLQALDGSISLAKTMGVSDNEILHTKDEISSYFTE